jgi:hypothetical protein
VVEQRERKASSEWASLRRVRLHEPVRVVDAAGNPSILPITALHLFFANSTSSAIPFASIICQHSLSNYDELSHDFNF